MLQTIKTLLRSHAAELRDAGKEALKLGGLATPGVATTALGSQLDYVDRIMSLSVKAATLVFTLLSIGWLVWKMYMTFTGRRSPDRTLH